MLLSCLDSLARIDGIAEVVVAAHGEAPAVRRRAKRCAGLTWVECPVASRGEQLNRGAAAARGDTLLFLHADTRLPAEAALAVRSALSEPGVVGGGFRLAFDTPHPALALLERLSALHLSLAYLGDQALFCCRREFEVVGGFTADPLFEDVHFVRRIARRGRLVRIGVPVTTSARRFRAAGPWRQLTRNAFLLGLYHLGVPSRPLAELYRP